MTRVTGIAALRMWERIAQGEELDAATHAWLRDTASDLVTKVFKGKFKGKRRSLRAEVCLKAVGYIGTLGNLELAELAQSVDAAGHPYPVAVLAESAPLLFSSIEDTRKEIKKAERRLKYIRGKGKR